MAFVTLLYGNQTDYINGAILTGLGLRNQNIKHKAICLITFENIIYKEILNEIYDEVIEVPYISSKHHKDGILLSQEIADPNNDYYTKLNIFNKDILNYEKIVFIDTDLIPIEKFDDLFDYDCPAAWLEKNMNGYITWGHWDFNDNQIIPSNFTDQTFKYCSSINAGLMVIEPNKKLYDDMINTLKDPELFKSKHIGSFDENGYFKLYKYFFCEQQFLSHELKGKWRYINALYNGWGYDNYNVYGIHMAGLHRNMGNKRINYKTWNYQNNNENAYNFHTNTIFSKGIIQYPNIKDIILKNLIIDMEDKKYKISDIKNNENLFSKLTDTQKMLVTLL